MLVVHVQIQVKPDRVEVFKTATLENVRNSLQEPGILRFDFSQQKDDAARFVLVEVYRDAASVAAHKETRHYAVWRDAVAGMMAGPRQRLEYTNVSPTDADWR
jgi:quinol monooxygenase YgiN